MMAFGDVPHAEIIDFPASKRQRSAAAIAAVKLCVEEKMDYLFEGLVMNASDALFEEMWSMDKYEAKSRQFNVMRYLKVQADEYRRAFHGELDHMWECLLAGQPAELEVPDGLIEEMMKLNSRKVVNHYKVLIKEIQSRFNFLTGMKSAGFVLHPMNFYVAFWRSIQDRELSYHERYTMEVLFHRFVMDRYGQVLGTVNRTLIDHRVEIDLG
jgi:hypothetical protein